MSLVISETHTAIPPGETMKEILKKRQIDTEDFADAIHLSIADTEDLLEGRIALSEQMASTIEAVLDISKDTWLNLEETYEEDLKKVLEEGEIFYD